MNDRPVQQRRRGVVTALLDLLDDYVIVRVHARMRKVLPDVVITKIPGTRTYEYRLPIWDLREECVTCAGAGVDGARPCAPCDGTGVITHDPAAVEGAHR